MDEKRFYITTTLPYVKNVIESVRYWQKSLDEKNIDYE